METLVVEVAKLRGELLLPPTALARETDAATAYARHYAQEKKRVEERERRRREEKKKQPVSRGLESEKRPALPRRRLSQEAKNLAKPQPPAAVAVVVEERKLEDSSKDDIAVLEKQLAANRRASVSLQRTMVQKAIVNAASAKKKEEKEKESDAELTSTSLDSTSDDDEDKNTSFATAQLVEDDLPKSLRVTSGAGEEDSDIEIIDEHADRRGSFVGKRGTGPPGEKKASGVAAAAEEPNDTSETKEEILEVFRAWGGREAVEAAEAGDAAQVRRAIERHDAGRIESMNLSPRSRDRALFGKLQKLIKSSARPAVNSGSNAGNKPEKLSEARQRLAVSLQRNMEAARVAQEAEAESRSTKTAQEKALTLEEEDDAFKNFTMANQKIREILEYKNKVQVTEEDSGVTFVDGVATPSARDEPVGDGGENVAGEMEQKMQLINHLLLMLQQEQAK